VVFKNKNIINTKSFIVKRSYAETAR